MGIIVSGLKKVGSLFYSPTASTNVQVLISNLEKIAKSKSEYKKSPLDDESKQYELRMDLVNEYRKANKEKELFNLLSEVAFNKRIDTELRAQAICCFSYFMVLEEKANLVLIEKLLDCLNDASVQIRGAAVYLLTFKRHDDARVMPVLLQCINDEDAQVQKFTIGALQCFNPRPDVLKAFEAKLNTLSDKNSLKQDVKDAIEFVHIGIQADLENELVVFSRLDTKDQQIKARAATVNLFIEKYGEPLIKKVLSNIASGTIILYPENKTCKKDKDCQLQAIYALKDLEHLGTVSTSATLLDSLEKKVKN